MPKKRKGIFGMVDLHDRPEEIRRLLHKGETLLLTKRGKAFAAIKPMDRDSKIPRNAMIMGLSEVRENRDDFIFTLMSEKRIVLTYYGRAIGIVDPDIPNTLLKKHARSLSK